MRALDVWEYILYSINTLMGERQISNLCAWLNAAKCENNR